MGLKTEIIKKLKQETDSVSGQALCDAFGVSRTAVWKCINTLKEEGYQIEATGNKGYRIVEEPDVLTESAIGSLMQTKKMGNVVCAYEEIDSTNTEAKRLAEQGAVEGTLVTANYQTAGKGRRGRVWENPVGSTISMSVILRPDIAPVKASMLTLVMALSVSKAIENVSGLETQIKWPNDIIIHKKKVCGILTEMSAEMNRIHYVIIGCGINTGNMSVSPEVKDKATSLLLEGKSVKRAVLVADVLSCFEQEYERFLQAGNLAPLLEEYNSRLINIGKEVKILDPLQEYQAVAEGINESGELIVTKEDGTKEAVFSGEVSVRGIYGYV